MKIADLKKGNHLREVTVLDIPEQVHEYVVVLQSMEALNQMIRDCNAGICAQTWVGWALDSMYALVEHTMKTREESEARH
jgi:hypothetical protein